MVYILMSCGYIIAALITVTIGILHCRRSDSATHILMGIFALSALFESVGLYIGFVYHNNLWLYKFYLPIELTCYSFYFHYSVPSLRRWNLGWILTGFAFVWSVFVIKRYPADSFSNIYTMAEGVIIICLCLYSLFAMMLRDDETPPTRYFHFWLVSGITCCWCFSYISCCINHVYSNLYPLIVAANLVMLATISTAFFNLSRLQLWTEPV